MKINRHNYEEYFILYADKELSSDDRHMVEEFVTLNPDLKEELDVFLNTVLAPDPSIEFNNKEDLFHHDEALISYIDNELPAVEQLQLENLINSSPKLQQELDLYRKTKLQPETVVFENKSVLYRSTERRRVVSMTVIRWSVAAAVLLAIAITGVSIFNNQDGESGIATTNPSKHNGVVATPKTNSVEIIPSTEKKSATNEKKEELEPLQRPNNNQAQNIAQANTKQKAVVNKEVKQEQVVPENKSNNTIASNKNASTNELPNPINNPNINKEKDALAVNTDGKQPENVTNPDNNPYNNQNKGSDKTQDATPTFASATQPRTELVDEEGGQNKKSRGFFRKLTRVFEKNTGIKATDDEDKLHFAAFTVKLK